MIHDHFDILIILFPTYGGVYRMLLHRRLILYKKTLAEIKKVVKRFGKLFFNILIFSGGISMRLSCQGPP
jgi:hypothetical protein